MTARMYHSAEAFKQPLEQRLRVSATSGVSFARMRQLLVFDRFLARIVAVIGDAVMLKGGLVLEMRLARARTTRDIDLRISGTPGDLLGHLQHAGRLPLGDFMTFEVSLGGPLPAIRDDFTQGTGLRFRTECRLAGKTYGQPFGVDVGFDDPVFGEPDVIVGEDVLAFAGIAPPRLRLYPVETHIAEKLHAYTRPRPRPNSRIKDLPDLALLATAQAMDAVRVRAALEQTFAFRQTHPLPIRVPAPLDMWRLPYAALAEEDALAWATLDDVTLAVQAFLDPVLSGRIDARWNPNAWAWEHV